MTERVFGVFTGIETVGSWSCCPAHIDAYRA